MRAPDIAGSLGDRILQRVFQGDVTLDQVADALGVSLRREAVAFGPQLPPELDEVLDDSVVNERYLVGAVGVGVGVGVGRRPVGRPPGVSYPAAALGQPVVDHLEEGRQLALGLSHRRLSGRPDHGDSGAVVAPVLQPRQTVEKYRGGRPAPGVADYPAHVEDSSGTALASVNGQHSLGWGVRGARPRG